MAATQDPDQRGRQQPSIWALGAVVGTITAVVGVLSALLTLYSQASEVIDAALWDKLRGDFAPVGTVVASMLNDEEFAEAIGENVADEFPKRKWILADGSEVRGTAYARLTNNRPVPDLRNQFVRGLNPKGSREPGSVEQQSTARPGAPFVGVTSVSGADQIVRQASLSTVDRYEAGGNDYYAVGVSDLTLYGRHQHEVTITGGGDAETRPTNVGVYYYIKIN